MRKEEKNERKEKNKGRKLNKMKERYVTKEEICKQKCKGVRKVHKKKRKMYR